MNDDRSGVSVHPLLLGFRKLGLSRSVGDIDATARWYQEQLGFAIVNRKILAEYSLRVVYLETDGIQIELVEKSGFVRSRRPDPPAHATVQGVNAIMIWVQDVDGLQGAAKQRGIEIAFEPMSVKELGIRAFFIRDNEGNLIEFIQEINTPQGRG